MVFDQHIALNATEWDAIISEATPGFNSGTTPAEIMSQVLLILFPIAGGVLLIYLLIGGYNWMISGGDPKKVAAARGTITNALIGFIIMFASYWIVQLVGAIFNIPALQDIF